MKIYIFGNEDLLQDKVAFSVAQKLKAVYPQIEFVSVDINKDLPFTSKTSTIIMDSINGIDRVELIENNDLDKLIIKRSSSVHDFDLAFQLKYLRKLGKLGKITIIGIPMTGRISYMRIQSILRKLVAQDIQGS